VEQWVHAMPDARELARVTSRLIGALIVGAVIGWQRERSGKAAGLRTHMLVALGTSMFVIACIESGMGDDALSRVIQGLATGIGFLGAGTILKLADEQEIKGLTTAAGVWLTAALSVAVGLGRFVVTLLGLVLAWMVLAWLLHVERRIGGGRNQKNGPA
jgi:putative Mg2+ transporter-C (MgtC) family protein